MKVRGRPRVEEPGTSMTVWVRVSEYDRICRMAQQRDQTVSSLVRQLLILKLR